MNNDFTIGQIQDLYDFLNYNVKEGYIDEDTAQDYIERQDWKSVSALRDLVDMNFDYIREEPVSDAPDWVIWN